MIEAGDRVSKKRRGCARQYGTVQSVRRGAADASILWAYVMWDHGTSVLCEARSLKRERPLNDTGRRKAK